MELDFLYDIMHQHSFFLLEKEFLHTKASSHNICTIETKDFLPREQVDWFKNLIPTLDAFEEGNISNISPTVKVNIYVKPCIVKEILLGISCSPDEVASYEALFQKNRDIFAWSYSVIPIIPGAQAVRYGKKSTLGSNFALQVNMYK